MSRKKRSKPFGKRDLVLDTSEKSVQANQWQNSERQQLWLKFYLDPSERTTWGNSYQSALKAGYSESYARVISAPSVSLDWVRQARQVMRLNPEHLKMALSDMVSSKYTKDSDKIAAIKLLGIDQGMFVQKQIVATVPLEEALRELE